MTLPNYITLVRILLVPFFFTMLVSYQDGKENFRWIALAIFVVASLTDAVDGFIARWKKEQSELGRFLDPLADKLLLLSGYLGILGVSRLPYHPPLWVTVTIVFRDLIIILGLILLFVTSGKLHIQPNFLGKTTTAFQMLTLVFILLKLSISIPFAYMAAALTIISCLSYVVRDIKKVNLNHDHNH